MIYGFAYYSGMKYIYIKRFEPTENKITNNCDLFFFLYGIYSLIYKKQRPMIATYVLLSSLAADKSREPNTLVVYDIT